MTWTKARHDAAKQRCEAATRPPWIHVHDVDGDEDGIYDTYYVTDCVMDADGYHLHSASSTTDAAFIAKSRTDLPDALAEIERLQAVIHHAALILVDYERMEPETIDKIARQLANEHNAWVQLEEATS